MAQMLGFSNSSDVTSGLLTEKYYGLLGCIVFELDINVPKEGTASPSDTDLPTMNVRCSRTSFTICTIIQNTRRHKP